LDSKVNLKLFVGSRFFDNQTNKSAKEADLFFYVEQVLEISNEFIRGFKAVMEFKTLASNQNNYDETFSKV